MTWLTVPPDCSSSRDRNTVSALPHLGASTMRSISPPWPLTDWQSSTHAPPPRSTMNDPAGFFEHGHASPQYLTHHMSQHHPRQTVMSMRLLLHASEDLCSSRHCSRQRHPLGLTFHHHRWRKGFLQGKWKWSFLVKCYVISRNLQNLKKTRGLWNKWKWIKRFSMLRIVCFPIC